MPQLEKAIFHNMLTGTDIPVMFNPAEVAVKKQVPWNEQKKPGKDQAKQQFTAGKSRGISIKLEFDTSGMDGTDPDASDVRDFVEPIAVLANVPLDDPEAFPPLVRFSWGQGLSFTCVVGSINISYTRFNADGVPTRASMQVELLEVDEADYVTAAAAQGQSVEIREVQEGQTLSQASGDTAQQQEGWRDNAQGDENPRQPATGPRPVN